MNRLEILLEILPSGIPSQAFFFSSTLLITSDWKILENWVYLVFIWYSNKLGSYAIGT